MYLFYYYTKPNVQQLFIKIWLHGSSALQIILYYKIKYLQKEIIRLLSRYNLKNFEQLNMLKHLPCLRRTLFKFEKKNHCLDEKNAHWLENKYRYQCQKKETGEIKQIIHCFSTQSKYPSTTNKRSKVTTWYIDTQVGLQLAELALLCWVVFSFSFQVYLHFLHMYNT